VRGTDGLQTTITLGPVKRVNQDLSASLEMVITVPMPDQDEHLPETIEACVHAAALEVQRRLFGALIERADRELVLRLRGGKGGKGIQRRGTRPFTFKTRFGSVTVRRPRISHKQDGSIEVPSLIFDSCAPVFDVSPLVMGRGSLRNVKPSATRRRKTSLISRFLAV
jgi:hypothetical protein